MSGEYDILDLPMADASTTEATKTAAAAVEIRQVTQV